MTAPTQETTPDAQLPIQETGPAVPDNGPAGAETPQGEPKGNREARYRVERNTAREALTAAQARIEALHLREVERLASDLAQPGDLLSLGEHSLADLLDAAGDVDSAAVAESVAALIKSRPGLARNPTVRAVDRSQGSGSGGAPGMPTDFSGLLNNI
jgi:hypothetical protein